ncbi:MAG: GntR family transcriptional regulator [Caldilineaceae bacterium]|nr:GntR family transcriptional regulator [Caldilineaceae bacterium]
MLSTSILAASSQKRKQEASLSATAYRLIKEQIICLTLPPAALIDESELARELGIGLTPVRQALRRLAMENLVVILPRRGTLVADLNLSDLQKIYEIRIELEGLACRLAAERATPAQIEQMTRLLQDALLLRAEGENRQLLMADHQLHMLIAQTAHNEFLEEMLERLYGHVLRLWNVSIHRVSGLQEALDEHNQILEAIRMRNGAEASQLMQQHIRRFQAEFLSII